ncbi:hypothetical protein H6P81_014539 [Aristolochia fimbriata]|uniref:1-acyl-sn-glycerol-3-phosphate acyltransferase n=1 Tax=Aristolochia fimbriata TaxID=158543 RepID=A0AAV7EL45_ARIFI|nr:hypothetical protein H6P81_014539 [Aristolochia fimbriata]
MTSCLHFQTTTGPHLLLSSNAFLGFSRHLNLRRTRSITVKQETCFTSRNRRSNRSSSSSSSPSSSSSSSSSTRPVAVYAFLPVDPWAPSVDSQSIASQLFAFSLFPYLGFLYFITKSKSAPKLTLFGFYFLLAFVGATIPAGIYAKVHYGTCLSNVDWLHGTAESLLTLTNVFIVLGLRGALRSVKNPREDVSGAVPKTEEDQSSVEIS